MLLALYITRDMKAFYNKAIHEKHNKSAHFNIMHELSNKNILSPDLKRWRKVAWRRSDGREFLSFGATAEKARSPKEDLVRETDSKFLFEDLRLNFGV